MMHEPPRGVAGAETPEALFDAVRADDSARALVTFYDRASGERAELSAASLGNWVAKGHFLLGDELGLGRGDTAYVALPVHWMTVAIWLSVFSAGLALTNASDTAQVAFADDEGRPATRTVPEVFTVALLPWGRAGLDPGDGATDYVSAVRPQADAWASVRRPGGPGDRATETASRAELMHSARARAGELGLAPSARVLLTDRRARELSLTDVLAVLSVNGSLVLVRHAASATDDALIDQEKITASV